MGSVNTGGLNWARYDNRDKLQAMVEQQRFHKVNIACISELHNTTFFRGPVCDDLESGRIHICHDRALWSSFRCCLTVGLASGVRIVQERRRFDDPVGGSLSCSASIVGLASLDMVH